MRKKVLYVITKSNFGGAQKYVFELASVLPKNEYEVAVALGGTGARSASAGLLAEKLSTAGIRTIFLPSLERNIAWWREFLVLFALIELFKKERPDVVHLNSSKVGGTGSLAARIAGVKKIIYTAHGWAFSEVRPLIQTLAIKAASWLTMLFSTHVITITEADTDAVQKWPLVGHKAHLIHNGIDAAKFTLSANTKIRDAFPPKSIIVGTIGELHLNKQQWLMVEAAKVVHKNICIAIVGEGEERANLEKEIANYGIADRVKLFGFMSAAEALPNFDIFVLPSQKEGLPYAILEAGLAKLPVIATRVGGTPDIINRANGVLFDMKEFPDLFDALEELAGDSTKRTRLGTNLHSTVTTHFSFEKMLSKTKELYR